MNLMRTSMDHLRLLTLIVVSLGILPSPASAQIPTTQIAEFGKMPSGEIVHQFTLSNSTGMQVSVIEFGATLTQITVPDREGNKANVVLASDSLETYLKGFPAAAVMGRYGGRIGRGRFMLDGQWIQVTKNSGENHIHGGKKHFGKSLWKGTPSATDSTASVKLAYTSPDGEEGFPGTMQVSVTYSLTNRNELKMEYTARSDKRTVINLTNHAYFNLAGKGSDVLGHVLQIEGDRTAASDRNMLPTGALVSVDQTALDFRTPHTVGERIAKLYGSADGAIQGYDHTYELRGESGKLRFAAKVIEPKSGRTMECYTTEPAIQLFTANGFNNNPFPKHGGLCLETQHYPDSPNRPEFPSVILEPMADWTSTTVYSFSCQ